MTKHKGRGRWMPECSHNVVRMVARRFVVFGDQNWGDLGGLHSNKSRPELTVSRLTARNAIRVATRIVMFLVWPRPELSCVVTRNKTLSSHRNYMQTIQKLSSAFLRGTRKKFSNTQKHKWQCHSATQVFGLLPFYRSQVWPLITLVTPVLTKPDWFLQAIGKSSNYICFNLVSGWDFEVEFEI